MVIFLSVGPVISTRRSTRPAAGGAIRQLASSRISAVSGRKSSIAPPESSAWRRRRRGQQLGPARAELGVESGDEVDGLRREDLVRIDRRTDR